MALLTLAVGLIAKSSGVNWRAETQPLFILFDPVWSGWGLLALATVLLGLFLAFMLWRSRLRVGWFAFALFGLTLFTRLGLNLGRHGPSDWYEIFSFEPGTILGFEYLSALPYLDGGMNRFLDDFAGLVQELPVHVAGHPPGMMVMIDWLGINSAEGLAAVTIVVGALATPLLYFLARSLFDETTARVAGLLFVFVPTSLLYGVTSADALFVTLGLAAALCLLSRQRWVVVLGAFLLTLASFFSYALLAAGGWAGLVRWRRDGFRSMAGAALACAAVLVAFYGLLFAFTGFDVLGAISATSDRYHDGIANVRPLYFWLFGSPAAFILMLGPVAWFAARSLASREITALALTAIIVFTSILGYTKAETERIWFFLVPFACLAAARALPGRGVKPVLVLLAIQAFAIEILFATRW
ncbi:MAG: hypothetical protein QG596_1767 [Actinomycetota bacterium]|nr:hypothetical protein [Actinomycetota bacterium]